MKSENKAADKPSASADRPYYEVWGDSLATLQRLWMGCAVLLATVVILLIILNRALNRPPVVIRVDNVGKAEAITDYAINNRVTQVEAKEFVRLFMRDLLERNFLTYEDNWAEVDRLSTEKLVAELNSNINWKDETSAIIHGRLACKLILSEITVTQETSNNFLVTVKGYRKITSTDNDRYNKETVFESSLGINKLKRSPKVPYGLLVDSYRQEDFK